MNKCTNCGSYAINPHQNGRGGDNLELCDVCYWRAKVARLEEALSPFAEEACEYDPDEGDDGLFAFDTTIKIGQLREASRVLEEK